MNIILFYASLCSFFAQENRFFSIFFHRYRFCKYISHNFYGESRVIRAITIIFPILITFFSLIEESGNEEKKETVDK